MKTCSYPDCSDEVWAGGLCNMHYMRRYRTGTAAPGRGMRRPFNERLWAYIEKKQPEECWPWIGRSRVSGYGSISRGGRSGGHVLAHRAVWEEENGPIPPRDDLAHGFVVLHLCDNRLCCNPRHLRLATQTENVRDMDQKGRRRTVSLQGSKRPKAKHTEKQIRAFLRDKRGTIKERAERHGVTIGVAKMVLYGKRWSHVK